MIEDYCDLLGVSPEATPEEIKAAYRREAMRWHPDRNGGNPEAAERFKQIQLAFHALSNGRTSRAEGPKTAHGQSSSTAHGQSSNASPGDIYEEAYQYWKARERGDLSSKDLRWRSPFRGRGLGIGGVVVIVLVILQVLHAIFGNGN